MQRSLVLFLLLPLSTGGPGAQDRPGAQAQVAAGERLYVTQCTRCHGDRGDGVSGVDLSAATLRRAATDTELAALVRAGVTGTAMPAFAFADPEMSSLVAYLASLRRAAPRQAAAGDAASGRRLFDARCVECHRVAGRGAYLGPDLTDIGSARNPAALERALIDPAAALTPANRSVRAVLGDGTAIDGRRLNEDTYSVQIVDGEGRLRSLLKAALKEYAVVDAPRMTSYRDTLTPAQIADIVAYLGSLKGDRR